MANQTSAPDQQSLDKLRTVECYAYIDGYTDGSKVRPLFCINGAGFETMAKVYVAYIDAHPKLLDQPKWTGLLFSLEDAYPCPVKKK